MPKQRNTGPKKPVIFISYLSEEFEAANLLKSLLNEHLNNEADIFISDESILPGEPWLKRLFQNLKAAVAEIIMCSPAASERHWIHFEAGAGWMRSIPVVPVYFAGQTLRNLPEPLRHLDAVDASDPQAVARLIQYVATVVGVVLTNVNTDRFLASMQEINARSMIGPAFPRFVECSADIQAELPHMIRSATQSILLCGIHFNVSFGNRMADYLAAMASGVSLSVSTVRAESTAIEHLAQFLGEEADDLRGECKLTETYYNVLKRERAKQKEAHGKRPGKLNLRFARRAPTSRSYVFDHATAAGNLVYVPYLAMRPSTECPSIIMRSNHAVYRAFLNSGLHQMEASDLFYESE